MHFEIHSIVPMDVSFRFKHLCFPTVVSYL